MNTPPSPSTEQTAWPLCSVHHFFSGINWENRSMEQPLPTLVSGTRILNPTMTVGEFLGAIPWDGARAIAPSVDAPALLLDELPQDDDMTLDDFFGSF